MKGLYIQFMHKGLLTGNLIDKCGSDSVHFVDGRKGIGRVCGEAVDLCRTNGHEGFRLCRKIGSDHSDVTCSYRVFENSVEC